MDANGIIEKLVDRISTTAYDSCGFHDIEHAVNQEFRESGLADVLAACEQGGINDLKPPKVIVEQIDEAMAKLTAWAERVD